MVLSISPEGMNGVPTGSLYPEVVEPASFERALRATLRSANPETKPISAEVPAPVEAHVSQLELAIRDALAKVN